MKATFEIGDEVRLSVETRKETKDGRAFLITRIEFFDWFGPMKGRRVSELAFDNWEADRACHAIAESVRFWVYETIRESGAPYVRADRYDEETVVPYVEKLLLEEYATNDDSSGRKSSAA